MSDRLRMLPGSLDLTSTTAYHYHKASLVMAILIGADIVPTYGNSELFEAGDIQRLFGEDLIELLWKADYRICNLETPLCTRSSPILKSGPNLQASELSIKAIKKINIDLVTLANNHILDQDVQGLCSTRRILKQEAINHVGVGDNPAEAALPFIFERKGKSYGVYACAENEFSIVQTNRPGANPFDPLESFDHVAKLKKECDYVIVLYHGGKEYYRYPSPQLQRVCRKFIDKGADLVLCQHSHCIGCFEKYESGTILYGQGNFLFDLGNNDFLNSSLLVSINDNLSISFIPLCKNGKTVRRASQEESNVILQQFYRRSEEIKTSGFVESKYREFVDSIRLTYLDALTGKKSFVFKIFNKILGKNRLRKILFRTSYNRYDQLKLLNHIRCEAHREVAICMLSDR